MLLSSLGTSIANVGLPTLAHSFNAPFQQVQWIVLAYLLAITTLIVSAGRLGDVIGRRRLMLGGIALFTLASSLCGIAPSLWFLITARVLQGLGAAIMMALTMAMVGETVPKERAGSAMGLLGTMSAVGTALGPTLGGVLINWIGWPALFFINLPLGILTLALAYRYLPRDNKITRATMANFDLVGTAILAMTLAAYAFAMTIGHGSFGQLNIALIFLSFIGIGVFVIIETRVEAPLIQMDTFKNPMLSAGLTMSALVTTVVMATLIVGPFYLSGALGLDPAHVGLVMSAGPFIAALTGAPAGRIVDRLGSYQMGIFGLIGMFIGTTLLALIPTGFGIPGYVAPLVVLTASYAFFQAANNTAVMSHIRSDQRGALSGLLNLSRNLGLITGASLMGTVFAAGAASADLSRAPAEALVSGMRLTFTTAAALILLALAITLTAKVLSNRPLK